MTKYFTESGDKIELGKCYRTRDGRRAFVSHCYWHNDNYVIFGILQGDFIVRGWHSNGRFSRTKGITNYDCNSIDLISAWEDESIINSYKLEVTDEMVQKYLDTWFGDAVTWGCDDLYRKSVKVALQAVFDHIDIEDKQIRDILTAKDAEPIDIPQDAKGYFKWLKEKPKKQSLLDFMSIRQNKTRESVFSDRDDYTRWLVGEISEYLEQK